MPRKSAYTKALYAYIKPQGEQLFVLKVIWLVFQKKLCSSLCERGQEHFRTTLGRKPDLHKEKTQNKAISIKNLEYLKLKL